MMGLFGSAWGGEPVRKPAVAGQFYPGSRDALKKAVEQYLAGGQQLPVAPRVMVSPHAGYEFSGPVAGKGFSALDKNVTTVILLGPPHRVPVQGIAVPGVSFFETPLGKVPLDRERIQKLLKSDRVHVDDNAHAPEHSLEVQIPFLQVRLSSFTIVPLLVNDIDPETAAGLLFPLIDERTAIVASSDFSHYHAQEEARKLDDGSIETIRSGIVGGPIDACGELPIRVVMALAKKMGLAPRLLDARTSYDTAPQYGKDRGVVGYASIVFLPAGGAAAGHKNVPAAPVHPKQPGGPAPDVKHFLLTLARQALEAAVRGEKPPSPQQVPEMTKENRGCFVTLTVQGALRGCIGYIEPIKPLYQAVIENAGNAALSDPRFNAVRPDELKGITVEVSVLTRPEPLEYKDPQDLLNKLVPKVDGIILQKGFSQSTFLPQVWEQLPDKVQFLQHLSLKGGMPIDGWKTANVKRYRAEHFSEQE